jgi:hypothetical protein
MDLVYGEDARESGEGEETSSAHRRAAAGVLFEQPAFSRSRSFIIHPAGCIWLSVLGAFKK